MMLQKNEEVVASVFESEVQFRHLIEHHSAIMLLIDPLSRIIIDANPAAAGFYGYPLENMRGMSVERINARSEAEMQGHRQMVLDGKCDQFEVDHKLASGEVRTVKVLTSSISIHGQPFFFSIIYDVTASRQAEIELEKRTTDLHESNAKLQELNFLLEEHRNHLEDLVATRTAELNKAKLAAEAANVAKSAFLANMNHEMRTPLHQISGLSSLIRREPLSVKQTDQMDKLDSVCRQLTRMVGTILELTDLEARQFELSDEPLSLDDLLNDVAASVQAQADAKKLTLRVVTPLAQPRLRGCAVHLKMALQNYTGNAIRYTEAGSITIRSSVIEGDEHSLHVRFEVEDTGIGVSQEDLPRLFNIFEQANNSASRRHGGLGVGLAITKKLAISMGGDAGCASSYGKGSLFWFSARLKRA